MVVFTYLFRVGDNMRIWKYKIKLNGRSFEIFLLSFYITWDIMSSLVFILQKFGYLKHVI